MAQFSLSWAAHKQNICNGLSILQQNGEFVDMTLAADGHHVKVHQMVVSLFSPFIKELISSASCPHPVIFLNKISYSTLCAILEYIYTGEVLVGRDNLSELVEAGKELHIKGLEDMKLELTTDPVMSRTMQAQKNEGQPLSEAIFVTEDQQEDNKNGCTPNDKRTRFKTKNQPDSIDHTYEALDTDQDDTNSYGDDATVQELPNTRIQYTLSNQGSLQMILNRFIYYLRYTSRKGPQGHRQWRCVEYVRSRCPALVVTKDDVVVKRFAAHNHPFHDKRIMKKVRDKAIYSAITEAEILGKNMKIQKNKDTKDQSAEPDTE